jgi:hypothetical protein
MRTTQKQVLSGIRQFARQKKIAYESFAENREIVSVDNDHIPATDRKSQN